MVRPWVVCINNWFPIREGGWRLFSLNTHTQTLIRTYIQHTLTPYNKYTIPDTLHHATMLYHFVLLRNWTLVSNSSFLNSNSLIFQTLVVKANRMYGLKSIKARQHQISKVWVLRNSSSSRLTSFLIKIQSCKHCKSTTFSPSAECYWSVLKT